MKTKISFLFGAAVLFSGIGFSSRALAEEAEQIASCRARQIFPTILAEYLKADIHLKVMKVVRGGDTTIFATLAGYYEEPSGTKTTMEEVAKRSKSRCASYPIRPE